MSTDYAEIIKRAQLAKEGRQFEKSEWLEFECDPGKPSPDTRQIASDFTKRVVNLTDDWLVEKGKRDLIGTADEDRLAWLAYASIVGHGTGLWEKDGSTGLPPEVEGELNDVVKADALSQRMANAINDACSLEREEVETAAKRIRGKGKRELNEPTDPILDELRAIHGELERAKKEGAKGIARLKSADKRVHALPKAHKLPRPDRESLADVSHFLAAATSDRLATMKRAIRDNDPNAQSMDEATMEELAEILIDWAIDSLSAPIYRRESPASPAPPTGRTYGVTLDGEPVDFADFLAVNKETFGPELVDRLRALKPGERYRGGGGAQPEWVLEYLPYDHYVVTWHDASVPTDATQLLRNLPAALDFARKKSREMPGEIVLVHAGPNKFGQDTELGYAKNGTFIDQDEEARLQRERYWGREGAGKDRVTMKKAIEVARKLGIRPEDQPPGWLTQFTYGMNAELEHADVTGGDLVLTGRIALAHLDEAPDYYERLTRAGLEASETPNAEAPKKLAGDVGTIDDEHKILYHAAVTGSVPSYLYDIDTLRSLERRGLLAHPKQIADFHVFWITDAGRQAFSRGTSVLGGLTRDMRRTMSEVVSELDQGDFVAVATNPSAPFKTWRTYGKTRSEAMAKADQQIPKALSVTVRGPTTSDGQWWGPGGGRIEAERTNGKWHTFFYSKKEDDLARAAHKARKSITGSRQARDYDSIDDALANARSFLGAEFYTRQGPHVTVYASIDGIWHRATLMHERGLWHWPSGWEREIPELPSSARPIGHIAAEDHRKNNPIGADDGIPWVQVTRDPERYQAAMAHAKKLGIMNEPGKVYELLAPALAKEDQEVILVVLFDVRGQCRGVAEVHRGQRSRVEAATSDIMRVVIVSGAEGFMLVHNHPSGDASPSESDGDLTKAVRKAASVHPEIAFLDHLVIGLGQYYTFTGKKLVKVKTPKATETKPKRKKKGNRR